MPALKITNLDSVGSDLLTDSESFLSDLSEMELNQKGGGTSLIIPLSIIDAINSYLHSCTVDPAP